MAAQERRVASHYNELLDAKVKELQDKPSENVADPAEMPDDRWRQLLYGP